MKTIVLTIILCVLISMQLHAQCTECPENKGISTNPANPENCEGADNNGTVKL